MSIQSDLDKIEGIKKSIHTSIKNKGVDISNDTPFENYPSEIGKITGGSGSSDTSYILKLNTSPEDAEIVCTSNGKTLEPFETKYFASGKGSQITYNISKAGYFPLTNTTTLNQHSVLNVSLTGKENQIITTYDSSGCFILTPEKKLYASGTANPNSINDSQNIPVFDFVSSDVKDAFVNRHYYGYLNTIGELWAKGIIVSGTFTPEYTKIAENVKVLGTMNDGSGWMTAYIDNNNDLWMMGTNTYGEQGSGNTTTVDVLTKRAENVRTFYYYDGASYYITNTDELYICGKAEKQGSGVESNVLTFTKRAENVKKVCESYGSNSFYITNDDELWGTSENLYPTNTYTDTTNSYFKKWAENIKYAKSTGYSYNAELLHYITNDNDLYGSATLITNYYWLGNGKNIARQMDVYLASNVVDTCMCPGGGAAYINTDGDIYVAGLVNNYGLSSITNTFTKIVEGAQKMYGTASTATNGILIYLKDEYYGVGNNKRGKLGIDNNQSDLYRFTLLPMTVG